MTLRAGRRDSRDSAAAKQSFAPRPGKEAASGSQPQPRRPNPTHACTCHKARPAAALRGRRGFLRENGLLRTEKRTDCRPWERRWGLRSCCERDPNEPRLGPASLPAPPGRYPAGSPPGALLPNTPSFSAVRSPRERRHAHL